MCMHTHKHTPTHVHTHIHTGRQRWEMTGTLTSKCLQHRGEATHFRDSPVWWLVAVASRRVENLGWQSRERRAKKTTGIHERLYQRPLTVPVVWPKAPVTSCCSLRFWKQPFFKEHLQLTDATFSKLEEARNIIQSQSPRLQEDEKKTSHRERAWHHLTVSLGVCPRIIPGDWHWRPVCDSTIPNSQMEGYMQGNTTYKTRCLSLVATWMGLESTAEPCLFSFIPRH